jgi:hypothetical protein
MSFIFSKEFKSDLLETGQVGVKCKVLVEDKSTMSQAIVIVSPDGKELGTTHIEPPPYREWWTKDVASFLGEIEGLTTGIVAHEIDQYLCDTKWLGCLPRSSNEVKYFQKLRQTLMEVMEQCTSHIGVVTLIE